ncbi:endonuclease/exonuclease/phosphatase family protein [Actinomadura rupiterrae]|uniref:endonuclease/exonuclease/phosphatase family protein n=1 Tax=Actinomadura rupiterrae TaxID=559627 RepID=UPI0020A35FCF|nr:endonuclease/exonuclease/phosphatase family protein [Actinomadura rupiterrae]MCP2338999.1 endonuclease/exonuclease/phosphatase family metal-dependent hydrolase [Actinomadura rupiterrae]
MRVRLDIMAGAVVLLDVVRVFLPSLITVVGDAGSTPAELIGLYALVWFLAAFAAAPFARIGTAAAVLLLACRAALQFTDGGTPQAAISSIGLLAGLCWLVASAAKAPDARPVANGFIAGLAVSGVLHAALGGIDLVWRDGVWPWLVLALELAAFALTLRPGAGASGDQAQDAGALGGRVWWTFGPALLLWGLYTGSTSHAQASTDGATWAAVVVATGAVLSVAVAERPAFWTRHPAVPGVVLVLSALGFAFGRVTAGGIHGVSPAWTLFAQVAGQFALAGCLGWAARSSGRDRATRRGLATATGFLVFVVLFFAYYSAYDLGIPNRWVPVAAAVVVAAVSFVRSERQASSVRSELQAQEGRQWGVLAASVAGALLVSLAAAWPGSASWTPAPGGGLRVAAYNLRMGYGMNGTMTVEKQAKALRSLRPHVVLLSEVDRGWFLNGGRDQLRLISDRLGLKPLWAPAGDEVWGDALLTDLPVVTVRNHVLVKGGPTGAEALEVGVRWQGRTVTFIATHTQPPDGWTDLGQATQLARIARTAAATGTPVILGGDLNMQPSDRAFQILQGAGLNDAFASVRPFKTYPAGRNPTDQLDHILTTPGLTARDAVKLAVPYSDHLPVAVTLTGVR